MRSRLFIPFVVFLIFSISVPDLPAKEAGLSKGAVTIDADSITYDKEADTFYAKGDAVISFSEGVMMADTVILNRKTNDTSAEGNVMIVSEDDLFEGDKIEFNIETKTGIAYKGSMFLEKNHFYIQGSKIIKKGAATYDITDATATTCDGDMPDWKLKSSKLNVTLDGYGTLKHGKFLVKDVPVFYIPFLFFPVKTTRQSGFLFPKIGYSQNKFGTDIELPFFWAISENTDATFYQRYMEKRGFKEGAEFRYAFDKDTFGTIYGDFMNDSGPSADTAEGKERNWWSTQKRWSIYLNHETSFSPSLFLRADIRKVSDRWYFKDFSSNHYFLDNYSINESQRFKKIPFVADEYLDSLESTVRLAKNWQLYNVTALISDTDNFTGTSNDTTLQKYPEITLKGIKHPLLGTLLHLEFDATYDYYYRTTGHKGHLYDVQPILSLPMNIGDYLQLNPQIGLKYTFWDRNDNAVAGQNKQGNRQLYTAGATLLSEVFRIFDVGGKKIEKIRHSIKPELTYTYIPNVGQDDVPDYTVRISEQNMISYGLTNTLMAKLNGRQVGKNYIEFARLKLAQTFDITEATRGEVIPYRDRRPLSDIDVELDIRPFPYVSFSARNKYSVYMNDWNLTNYDVNLNDEKGNYASIGYRYSKHLLEGNGAYGSISPFSSYRYTQSPLQEINLFIKGVITKSIDTIYLLRRNELDKKTLESTIGLNYHKQCWSIDMKYSESETDRNFTVLFSLYGLGSSGKPAMVH